MQINHNNSCALNNIYIFYGFYDIDSYGVLCDDGIRLRQQPESEKKCHGEKTIKNLIFYHNNNNNNIRRVFGEGPSYDWRIRAQRNDCIRRRRFFFSLSDFHIKEYQKDAPNLIKWRDFVPLKCNIKCSFFKPQIEFMKVFAMRHLIAISLGPEFDSVHVSFIHSPYSMHNAYTHRRRGICSCQQC